MIAPLVWRVAFAALFAWSSLNAGAVAALASAREIVETIEANPASCRDAGDDGEDRDQVRFTSDARASHVLAEAETEIEEVEGAAVSLPSLSPSGPAVASVSRPRHRAEPAHRSRYLLCRSPRSPPEFSQV